MNTHLAWNPPELAKELRKKLKKESVPPEAESYWKKDVKHLPYFESGRQID